jgi:small subunit ribosomal protein S9
MSLNESYFGIGRRKTSVAKVNLFSGTGFISINDKPSELYLQHNLQYINVLKAPLIELSLENTYDVHVNIHGGGIKSQAEAIKLGIARALCLISSDNRCFLKPAGYLTRDDRCKERKKYGLRKARKAPQFSKR